MSDYEKMKRRAEAAEARIAELESEAVQRSGDPHSAREQSEPFKRHAPDIPEGVDFQPVLPAVPDGEASEDDRRSFEQTNQRTEDTAHRAAQVGEDLRESINDPPTTGEGGSSEPAQKKSAKGGKNTQ